MIDVLAFDVVDYGELDEYYDNGYMCFETDNFNEDYKKLAEAIYNIDQSDSVCIAFVDKCLLNEHYRLTDDNEFKKDLLVIYEWYNPKLKLDFGGRWFNMVIDIKKAIQTEIDMDGWLKNQTLFKGW